MPFIWLCISIASAIVNALFGKEAALIVGEVPEAPSEATRWFFRYLINPYNIASIFFLIPMAIGYAIAVSRLKLSFITPLYTAVPLVFIGIFSLIFFDEDITGLGWLGIVIIFVGVFLVAMGRERSVSKS